MKSQDVLEFYYRGSLRKAAEGLLLIYESGLSDSNLTNKLGSSHVVQRLGYEMAQHPELAKRLEAVAPRVFENERRHLLWLVPEMMEKYIPEDNKDFYRWQLDRMMEVFGTDSIKGIARELDISRILGINSQAQKK